MKSRHGQDGFSLLEVLVAFAILALSLGVLLQSMIGSRRGLAAAEQRLTSISLAETLLERVGADIPLRTGNTKGNFELEPYRWTLSVQEANFNNSDPRQFGDLVAYDVAVSVFNAEHPSQSVDVKTIRLDTK